jgi:hypothetical protein
VEAKEFEIKDLLWTEDCLHYLELIMVLGLRCLLVLQCLLVKGWKAGASWSFPRGKKNKDEEDCDCAVREVCFMKCG